MNNIVVGFDFSAGSANAVDLTIDIANRWQCDIRLVYVKLHEDEDETPIRQDIERRNKAVEPLLKGIKLEYVIRCGNVSEELNKQAEEDEASLIVVGTNGMSGYKRNWIGRNTYSTITKAKAPILCVREGFNFRKTLDKIIVPIDNTIATRQKVPIALKFALSFDSEIHVLAIHSSDNPGLRHVVDNYSNQVCKYLSEKGAKHILSERNLEGDASTLILSYADEIDADMIVIMTEQEKAITDWLLGSTAEKMLHESHRPILSIRPAHESVAR